MAGRMMMLLVRLWLYLWLLVSAWLFVRTVLLRRPRRAAVRDVVRFMDNAARAERRLRDPDPADRMMYLGDHGEATTTPLYAPPAVSEVGFTQRAAAGSGPSSWAPAPIARMPTGRCNACPVHGCAAKGSDPECEDTPAARTEYRPRRDRCPSCADAAAAGFDYCLDCDRAFTPTGDAALTRSAPELIPPEPFDEEQWREWDDCVDRTVAAITSPQPLAYRRTGKPYRTDRRPR